MTMRKLEIFASVAECGSMSAAARKLHISQSAVSQVVVEIEKKYDVLLFERYAHTLHLTPVGNKFLEYAKRSLRLMQETDAFLMGAANNQQMRVGASMTVGCTAICEILNRLREREPGLSVEVIVSNTQEIENKLLNYDLDIAVVEGRVVSEELMKERIARDSLVMICGRGHEFYGKSSVAISELDGQTMLFREEGSGTRELLENVLRAKKVVYHVGWVCNPPGVIEQAVKMNFGITAISKRMIRKELETGELWAFDVDGLDLSRDFTLVYHKDKYLTEIFDAFREECAMLREDA